MGMTPPIERARRAREVAAFKVARPGQELRRCGGAEVRRCGGAVVRTYWRVPSNLSSRSSQRPDVRTSTHQHISTSEPPNPRTSARPRRHRLVNVETRLVRQTVVE